MRRTAPGGGRCRGRPRRRRAARGTGRGTGRGGRRWTVACEPQRVVDLVRVAGGDVLADPGDRDVVGGAVDRGRPRGAGSPVGASSGGSGRTVSCRPSNIPNHASGSVRARAAAGAGTDGERGVESGRRLVGDEPRDPQPACGRAARRPRARRRPRRARWPRARRPARPAGSSARPPSGRRTGPRSRRNDTRVAWSGDDREGFRAGRDVGGRRLLGRRVPAPRAGVRGRRLAHVARAPRRRRARVLRAGGARGRGRGRARSRGSRSRSAT